MREGNQAIPNSKLCEYMLSPYNMRIAVNNVKRNHGSAGIDKMEIEEIESYMSKNWAQIKEQILAHKYKPQPVKRVEIPKDNGGVRLLGVPCVIDRVIQQAMVQVLQPLFEPTFSEYSYGFRPGRSAEDAVRKAQEYMSEGYKYVVDLDLSKFFDTVNHDMLMDFVDRTLKDKDIRRLIYDYLKCGVMKDGSFTATEEGTPQGGPLSPLLSNIYLTPYDKELEKRGLKFTRYADDSNVFTKSSYASRRVKDSVIRFLENKMKLKVNMEKTEARKTIGSSFLGFTFISNGKPGQLGYCKPKEKKLAKFKATIRELTKRNRGVSIEVVIGQLNAYIRGWINYYARSNISEYCKKMSMWIRRRIRQYLWKQWKTPGRRKEMLDKYCLKTQRFRLNRIRFYSSNRYWAISAYLGNFIPDKVINGEPYGLVDLFEVWKTAHSKREIADYNAMNYVQKEFDFTFS